MEYLAHHGILGQKWGVRRYQNPDGSLTPAGQVRREKRDTRWVNRNADRLYNKAARKSKREMRRYEKKVLREQYKDPTKRKYTNAYNQKLAEVMNEKLGVVSAPSGRVVKFVAKRGEIGVHMALADPEYDMSRVKNGVYANGRVAYKQNTLGKM